MDEIQQGMDNFPHMNEECYHGYIQRLSKVWQITLLYFIPYLDGSLMQWLKQPAWKVGDHRFVPRSGSARIFKDSILWGASMSLRPPGSEFRILCLEGSVTSFIHHLQEDILVQFSQNVHKCVLSSIHLTPYS